MTEAEIYQILREASDCFKRTDYENYQAKLLRANAEIERFDAENELRGEIILVYSLSFFRDLDKMLEMLTNAKLYLKSRSRIFSKSSSLNADYFNPFAIYNLKQGFADENSQKLKRVGKLFFELTGGGCGTDVCYDALMNYYRGNLPEAEALAKLALDESQKNNQIVISLCSAELLMNIAKHKIDKKLWDFADSFIRSVATNASIEQKYRIQAEVLCFNEDIALGILHTVPLWINSGDFGVISSENGFKVVSENRFSNTIPTAIITQIQYLSYSQQPIKMLNQSDLMEKCYKIDDVVSLSYLHFFRAGAYLQLKDLTSLKAEIEKGVKLVEKDGLWLIIAEFVPAFSEYVDEAVKKFCPQAFDVIHKIGKDYWKKIDLFRQNHHSLLLNNLTSREQEILKMASEGMTNQQISQMLEISLNTTKAHLKHAYEKLNIDRRTKIRQALDDKTAKTASNWTKFKDRLP